MSGTCELPCPNCGAAIAIPHADFFPTRKHVVVCRACGRMSRLPYRAISGGMLVLLAVTGGEMFIARVLGAHRPFTLPGLLGAGVLGVVILVSSLWAARLVCRNLTDHLVPDTRRPRP